ncbi:hypothetical protein M422DRAFT_52680 [Sphaerobolus stellatus SS14]|uniref:BTB domain-containing protein n=1 Tax=Sphaerobolus stellatus (strain SS14) TaxID=990650 RepID=A0A0C9UU78_SPHS4|nr:hypothetical protein M422DRAFT_52680 [Sphaerobolus stellatus SS14]
MAESRSKITSNGKGRTSDSQVVATKPVRKSSPKVPVGAEDWKHHPDLYMQDGTLILLAEDTVFRVYPGLLAMHSEVFRGMSTISDHLPEEIEIYDGYPVVRLTDDAEDLAQFLKSTMGINQFHAFKPTSFPIAAAVLRLSSKYMVDPLRHQTIEHFRRLIPKSFEDIGKEQSYKQVFGEENPPHPFTVLTLFRQCQLTTFLPWAFYTACNEGFKALVNGDTHDGAVIRLKTEDNRIALNGWKRLCDKTRQLRSSVILSRPPTCKDATCANEARLAWLDGAYWHIGSDVLSQWGMFKLLATSSKPTQSPGRNSIQDQKIRGTRPCDLCTEAWLRQERELRVEAWTELPSYFGLPAWEDMTMEL